MIKYLFKDYNRFIIAVWVAIFIVFFVQFAYGSAVAAEAALLSMGIVSISYFFTTYLSTTLLQNAIKKKKMKKFAFQFILTTITISVLITAWLLLFSYLAKQEILSPYFIIEKNSSILRESIGAMVTSTLINFGFCGLRFYELNLKLQKELLESQLQILQEQINPHFMFNVLNHVHVLIRKEPELADSLLLQYTDILRYQLYNGKKEYISIEKEVQFLKNFIDVEKVRWKNKLDIQCTWKVEDPTMEFPPLLLITFIENAFKHVSRSSSEKGYVMIDFEQKDKQVRLEVENSNSGIKPTEKSDSGIGLTNIKKRLDIIFPDKYSLEVKYNDVTYSVKLIINT
ncbi:two-component system LytT family sensor kinase [Parabacteroides sp. PF5-5]|uniref:sensor histidine kinase n=1 Tax=unclassified Parabacteroides TaxID=2649774 RepID=UPI002475E7E3|nr:MULTISPECIES: histidine kinase [unclassified Parabacteroides]MDH6303958.1 two-component system LytT family sensor kinase [Parabacteroides sp. PH5-39]MDH6314574.1 two-component system LytT family sensor kinase [Parabacteroides sp. PF5-13]MDH6318361.1 two-component system LytT family sensor kinase [Parabacteroides sp. PH5-13]MDH6322347.1 two-component system LytT family sensor kinase [Parabacteroides sp. PH5-8]MDH6325574.1 two-component system LytT family sensor kinase [Parabacteroides sp. PH